MNVAKNFVAAKNPHNRKSNRDTRKPNRAFKSEGKSFLRFNVLQKLHNFVQGIVYMDVYKGLVVGDVGTAGNKPI